VPRHAFKSPQKQGFSRKITNRGNVSFHQREEFFGLHAGIPAEGFKNADFRYRLNHDDNIIFFSDINPTKHKTSR